MSKSQIVPMDSYRMVKYSRPIRCFICEGENLHDAEHCRFCCSPIALAHQTLSRGTPPHLVAALGASGAGKTVYLGMLMDMLSRQPGDLHVLARGAFSITLQQTAAAALARGEFPPPTSEEPESWNWVHCQVRRRRKPIEMIFPDMAGDVILNEADHPGHVHMIHEFVKKCSAAVILLDATSLRGGSQAADYVPAKLTSYLIEAGRDRGEWGHRPLAVIFTKADECPGCVEDPASFAQANAAGFWQQCRERFPVHQFFAASAAARCVWRETPEQRIHAPLRIEPVGIVEPFVWLLEQFASRRFKHPAT